jgi:hypothetical protein
VANAVRDPAKEGVGGSSLTDRDSRYTTQVQKYEDAGRDLSTAIPSFISIDEALHWFATSRPEIVELGKLAIVREILQTERASRLFAESHPQSIPDADFDDTWLPHFLSMVMAELKMEDAGNAFRNVTVINFNYDRTLEHYLYSALQTKFGLTESGAQKALLSLKVIRPYGKIGSLPWQDAEPSIDFGMPSAGDAEKLLSLLQSIRTYTEQEITAQQATIQPEMDQARMVVFLGFGFHEQNMRLLRARSAESWRRAYATMLRMDRDNYPTMRTAIARTVGCLEPNMPLLLDAYARRLLVDLRPSLMAAAHM